MFGINLNQKPLNQLDKIIDLALSKGNPDGSSKTTVVSLHLSQMREWGVRGGNIQFKAIQDFNNIRKEFIGRWVDENNIKAKAEPMMDRLVAKGEVLQVITPSMQKDTGYRFDYYVGGKNNPDPDYLVFYQPDEYGEDKIECVVIRTSTEVSYRNGMGMGYDIYGQPLKQWKLIFIDAERYIYLRFNQKPQDLRSTYHIYQELISGNGFPFTLEAPTILENPFAPDFPFCICKNIDVGDSEPGVDDFYPIKDLIEDHNFLLLDAVDNLRTFYTPTMVTSRSADAVLEDIESYNERKGWSNTYAAQNGFVSPFNRYKNIQYRMPRVIGNLKDSERFGYVEQPDTISGDQNLFIRQLRELIHWSLGGVDPLGISASATFGEIKSLFGRIENTAGKKAETLFGSQGLCNLISKILLAEERKCKFAIAQFIINQYLQGSQIAAELIQQELSDEQFRVLYFHITDELGLALPGLPSLGQRNCNWRYTKDVYQRTTREQQEASIVYRNEREDGISQEIALAKLYPNMSDEELRQSMSGFSPRVVANALNGIAGALQLYVQLMQIPSPLNPDIPWALDLGIDKIVEQGILTLQKEMNYNIPEFRESPDYDQINFVLNNTLQQLNQFNSANVRSTIPALPSGGTATDPRTIANRF